MRASKYLGSVKPWEWDAAPAFWLEATLTAESAEAKAEEQRSERERRKTKPTGAGMRARRR